jgi:hypothetical protein
MDKKYPTQTEQSEELFHRMSQWRQANPLATLTEIEEAVEAELAPLRKQLVEAMVQEAASGKPAGADCPHAVKKWSKMGGEHGN